VVGAPFFAVCLTGAPGKGVFGYRMMHFHMGGGNGGGFWSRGCRRVESSLIRVGGFLVFVWSFH